VAAGSVVLHTASTAEAWREFWGIAVASSDGNEAAHGVGDGSEGGAFGLDRVNTGFRLRVYCI
jgi:hypothetical protein